MYHWKYKVFRSSYLIKKVVDFYNAVIENTVNVALKNQVFISYTANYKVNIIELQELQSISEVKIEDSLTKATDLE